MNVKFGISKYFEKFRDHRINFIPYASESIKPSSFVRKPAVLEVIPS